MLNLENATASVTLKETSVTHVPVDIMASLNVMNANVTKKVLQVLFATKKLARANVNQI